MPYEKRYTSADNSMFEMWQIRTDGSSRQIWNWETREDYDPNAVIEIPYVAPPPLPEPIPPTLEELKAAKVAEISAAQDTELSMGCPIQLSDGRTFRIDCEPKNQGDFSNMLLVMQTFGLTETTVGDFDNQLHALTLDEFKELCLQLVGHIQYLMGKKWTLRSAANAAQSAGELSLIIW